MIPTQISNEKVTPLVLDVLIHYHCSPTPHPRFDAPGIQKIIPQLVSLDILTPTKIQNTYVVPEKNPQKGHKIFSTTPRGKAWVELLCETIIPTQR